MLKFTKNKAEKIATIHGTLTIKEDGTVEGLTPEQEKEFSNIPGFEFEEEKKTTRKQSSSTSKEEEPKEEEKKASTRKSTSTTRKSTARKTTAKKDEDK